MDPSPLPTGAPPTLHLAPPRRRRPMLAAASAALVALSTAGFATLYHRAARGTAVVTVVRAVPAGTVVGAADLGRATVRGVAGLAVVPAGDAGAVVGRRAATTLEAGTLLAPGELTAATGPAPGRAVVGVALKPGQAPADGLGPGARVDVVLAPPAGSGAGDPAVLVAGALVVDAVPDPDGSGQVVSVDVPRPDAPAVAAAALSGQAALVLVGGGR